MQFPALDRLPVPVFRCNRGGTLTYVNEAWTRELGVPVGDDWRSPFAHLDTDLHASLWRRCAEAGDALKVSLHAEPSGLPMRWYELVVQPAADDSGATVELLGSLIDVTDRTVAAAEMRAILETAVDAIITIDEESRIQLFNPAASRLFGYTPEEVQGRNVRMLMGEPHAAAHDQYVRNYLETGVRKIIGIGREVEAKTKDGRRVPIDLAVSEIELEDRRCFAAIIRDLTVQHAVRETMAEQREKLAHVGRLSTMGEMTASIAHEINQPLTAIAMYAQASLKMLSAGHDPAKIADALEKLAVQALRAGAVIERIQRFARAQDSVRELADVNELIRDLLKLAGSDARMHAIDLDLELADGLPRLYVDPIQIQQVVLNLIRNAIDAMQEIGLGHGNRITVRTRELPTGGVEVAVSDLGTGVAEDQSDLLFTPFHTTKKDGMGMGLSICRTIVSEHGGVLDHRNNEGAGATFYFNLPPYHE